jgi:Nucleotidyl transferase AbiEii toxin, Type IV TA system
VTHRYATAGAFRAALEDRLRQQSEESRRDLQWLRRRLAFTRVLARLAATAPDAWVLKGGMAVELRRPGLARSTRDIDLVLRPGFVEDPSDVDEVQETLIDSLRSDVDGDWFGFRLFAGNRLRDDAYGRPAWRFAVEASLARKTFVEFRLDVVARPEELDGVEQQALPDLLGFAGISPRSVCVTDLRQQYAEKLHAMIRSYASGGSTRVKDLLDLFLLVRDGAPADRRLCGTIERVFTVRGSHVVPAELPLPPASWQLPFERMAAEIGLPVVSYRDAHTLVAEHWRRARRGEGA